MPNEFGKRLTNSQSASSAETEPAPRPGWAPDGGNLLSNLSWLAAIRIGAAAFIGFGVILWVAANWDDVSKFDRFLIVGGVLAAAVAASLNARLRTAALMVAFLATGGLLALIGQTYQTGADPWSLFALWAGLTLPWLLAARHDSLWLGWVAVVMTAVELWLSSAGAGLTGGSNSSLAVAGWAIGLGLAVLLSPWSPLRSWLGETRWSFRVAALLTIAMVTKYGVVALFASHGGLSGVYFIALLLTASIAAGLAALAPLDLLLMSMSALGFDVLLITGLSRLQTGPAMSNMLLLGVVSASIVGGTGALLLNYTQEAHAGPSRAPAASSNWPALLMSSIGALMAAVPLLAFLALFMGAFLMMGPGTYLIGIITLVAACSVVRSGSPVSFSHQLGVIGLIVGMSLIAFGLFRDAQGLRGLPCLILAMTVTGLAFVTGRTWVISVLGASAALFTGMFVSGPTTAPALLLAAASLALLVLDNTDLRYATSVATAQLADGAERYVRGWTAAALFAVVLAAGPAFLLGGPFGQHMPHLPLTTAWSSISLLSAALALSGAALVLTLRANLATTLGLGVAFFAVVLSAFIPGLGGLVLLAACASLGGRRLITIGAGVAAVWVIGSFYYWLGLPLAEKAVLMIATGAGLALLSGFSAGWRSSVPLPQSVPLPPLLGAGLVAIGAALVTAFAVNTITTMEQLIASGRPVFIALAPVDPRSRMQGDYMALNFALPAAANSAALGGNSALSWAIGRVNERGIVEFKSLANERPALSQEEIALRLVAKAGRLGLGSDAWFFREGTAAKWQAARYGEFRVTSEGHAMLVNLVGTDLSPIR